MNEIKDEQTHDKDNNGFSSDIVKKIKSAANYCYNCNRCVAICPLSHLGIFSPRDLIYDLNFLSVEDALKSNNIWRCLTCAQCNIYCPMTLDNIGVRIPELILELRKISFDKTSEFDKIAQCETHDGIFPLISQIMANNPAPPDKLGFLKETTLKTRTNGNIAYFVGCLPLMEDIIYNFEVNYLDSAKAIIGLLNEAGIAPVVLNEKCCGHDILWGKGDVETFVKLAHYNVNLYKDAGVKTVICGCAEGYRTWKYDYPKIIKDFDFEVLHISEFFVKQKILEIVKFPNDSRVKVTYHDACRIGRLGGKLYDAPRELIKQIPGVELVEMENNKDDARCCGVSAFSGCNEYTRVLRQNRIKEAIDTGAEYLLVPCPKCLTHFNCYLYEQRLDEEQKQFKEKIKIMDLATFIGKRLFLI